MKQIEVKLESRVLVVKQLPLRKYAELITAAQGFAPVIASFEGLENDKIIEQLPSIVASSFPEVTKVLMVATDLKREEIEADSFGLSQAVDVVIAVIEVNDYKHVFEQIKKVTAQPKALQEAKTVPSQVPVQ